MDMKTTLKLAELYRNREQLQKHRERAMDRNVWIGFVNRGVAPKDSNGPVRDVTETEHMAEAIGGTGVLASLIQLAFVEAISKMQKGLDEEIKDLGGEV